MAVKLGLECKLVGFGLKRLLARAQQTSLSSVQRANKLVGRHRVALSELCAAAITVLGVVANILCGSLRALFATLIG